MNVVVIYFLKFLSIRSPLSNSYHTVNLRPGISYANEPYVRFFVHKGSVPPDVK